MKILVSGASGFLGSAVVDILRKNSDNFSNSDIITFRSSEYDLRDREAIRESIKRHKT